VSIVEQTRENQTDVKRDSKELMHCKYRKRRIMRDAINIVIVFVVLAMVWVFLNISQWGVIELWLMAALVALLLAKS
jgi:fatty acid desaturase